MPDIKVGSQLLTFTNVYYVDPINGNDTTGVVNDPAYPFKSINYVSRDKAVAGDCIYAMEGTHNVTTSGFSDGGLYDWGKSMTYVGDAGKTILYCNGSENTNRDHHAICTYGSSTKIYDMIFNVTVGARSESYAIAVFGRSSGNTNSEVYNCVFLYEAVNSPAMIYDNGYSSIDKLYNCSFKTLGNFQVSYTGAACVSMTNCVCNKSFYVEGTQTTCLSNVTYDETYKITSSGWQDTGTGLDSNGSVADLGVYGGIYNWEGSPEGEFSFSPTHIWYEDTDSVSILGTITCSDLLLTVQYKILSGSAQIYPSSGYTALQAVPYDIAISISKQLLIENNGNIVINLKASNEATSEISLSVLIEDTETLQFVRNVDTLNVVDWSHENISKTEITENGAKLQNDVEGQYYVQTTDQGRIVTEERATITSINVEGDSDQTFILQKLDDMLSPVVLGEGKRYSYTLDLTLDIVGFEIGVKES